MKKEMKITIWLFVLLVAATFLYNALSAYVKVSEGLVSMLAFFLALVLCVMIFCNIIDCLKKRKKKSK